MQTEIRIGNPGVPRASADYLPLDIADQILGGPSENRLFRALRTHQGLTYEARANSCLTRPPACGWPKPSPAHPETMKSLNLALEQMKEMRDRPITSTELDTAQGYLIGHLALDFETSENVASQTVELLVYNLPLDYWSHFPENLRALTVDQVWDAARRRLAPDGCTIVLVGNISGFASDLKKLGAVQLIPLAKVDFGAAEAASDRPAKPPRATLRFRTRSH